MCLKPVFGKNGIVRANTRLQYAEYLPYDSRYFVILSSKTLVKSYHEKGSHDAGTIYTLSVLSARFWLLQEREEIREWERKCNKCRKMKAKSAKQIMVPLPKF